MSTPAHTPPAPRVASVDAYRGLRHVPDDGRGPAPRPDGARRSRTSEFWAFLAFHQSHVEWAGCSLHDLIQPSFSFLVGVALPFSLASRPARGRAGRGCIALHALWRSVLLVALGVFLRSIGRPQTNFTFEDTLSQIGLGYVFLFLLGCAPRRDAVGRPGGHPGRLLGGVRASTRCPARASTTPAVGVPPDWPHHPTGFAAHWNKNTNLAWAFDRWFLNLFPREQPFTHNGGGYATLSFIPTLGTMILGLIAGGVAARAGGRRGARSRRLVAGRGRCCLAAGWGLDAAGVCPIVKRIWTPSWVLFSGGWCFLFLAGFYGGARRWRAGRAGRSRCVVIGANSIAAYCMAHLIDGFVLESFRTHLGRDVFARFGPATSRSSSGAAVLLVFWLILFWMYRRRVFLKI